MHCAVAPFREDQWIVSALSPGAEGLHVYSHDGMFVGQLEVGSNGFPAGRVGVMHLAPDTLVVMDQRDLTLHVLLADGTYLSRIDLLTPFRYLTRTSQGRFVTHHPGHVGDGAPLFNVVDMNGYHRGFGEAVDTLARHGLDEWTLDAAAPSGLWTAHVWSYELYHWARPDSLLRTIVRQSEWFPSTPRLTPSALEQYHEVRPLPPVLSHVHDAGDGILWVYAWVSDLEWEAMPIQTANPAWTRRTYDTVIEVVDIAKGRVISRARFDLVLAKVCRSHLVFAAVDSDSAGTEIVVFEPSMEVR